MSILSKPYFHNEEAAYKFVESRLWHNGPVCPRCKETERVSKMQGKSTRIGTYKCYVCRKPFTVKIGTIFESSHVKMNLWLQAIFLIASSKKGISSNQLHRTLGVTLKNAWFMTHRIREAMRSDEFASFGSKGGAVEADETFIGHDKTIKPKGQKKGRGYHHKNKVLSLVDRSTGQARSFVVDDVKVNTLAAIVRQNLSREARLMTDEASQYTMVGHEFAEHGLVAHMKGVYQHCSHNHLHRYMAEYDFRYNNRIALGIDDQCRANNLLAGVVGKRLTYETVN